MALLAYTDAPDRAGTVTDADVAATVMLGRRTALVIAQYTPSCDVHLEFARLRELAIWDRGRNPPRWRASRNPASYLTTTVHNAALAMMREERAPNTVSLDEVRHLQDMIAADAPAIESSRLDWEKCCMMAGFSADESELIPYRFGEWKLSAAEAMRRLGWRPARYARAAEGLDAKWPELKDRLEEVIGREMAA